MRYIMVTHLSSKSRTSLERALNSHIAKYKRQGFVVKNMSCDGESGIHTLIPHFEIQSIQVEIAGPNTTLSIFHCLVNLSLCLAFEFRSDFNSFRDYHPKSVSFRSTTRL